MSRPWSMRSLAALVGLVACTTSPEAETGSGPPTTPTTTPATIAAPTTTGAPTRGAPTTAVATTVAPTTAPAVPEFSAAVSAVTAADLPASWRPGCPVAPEALRLVRVSFWGFDGQPHTGSLVVNASATQALTTVFRRLFQERFPIRRMELIDVFGGDDDASLAADNTSAFNCRNAVATGPPHWSMHAYGLAIDVNPVENPYVLEGMVLPPAGSAYLDRSTYRPGMAVDGGVLTSAFAAVGWQWGGRWASPDYQHFSSTGT